MILALETATDRASVAVGHSEQDAVEETVSGARRHASSLLPMVQAVLARAGARLQDVTAIAVSEGPGSFTGLRIGASVAKAIAQVHGLPLWSAPSLMVRAAGISANAGPVVALADALRGEIYAAAYRFEGVEIITVLAPCVCRPEELARRVPTPRAIVGDVPLEARDTIERWAGRTIVTSPEGAPSATRLLGLIGRAGGARQIEAPATWEPVYGRPAEAQARWETTHGRALSDSIGSPR